jgi:Protein of unknown function (DUF2752)
VTAETMAPVRIAAAVPLRTASTVRATPTTVAKRYAAVALVAIVLGALHIRHRPATLCLFREVTGLPCPFCGGTTAAVRLGHGDLKGALAASPLAVGLLATWPLLDAVRPPAWWHTRRNRWIVISTVLIAAEIWQLVRFGIISF